jgi:hypothetical protein
VERKCVEWNFGGRYSAGDEEKTPDLGEAKRMKVIVEWVER